MESEIEKLLVGSVGTVVETAPQHEPAPHINLVPRPDGIGSVALVKVGEDQWHVERFDGPVEGVSRHVIRSLDGFVRWLHAFATKPERAQVFVEAPGTAPVAAKIAARLEPGDPEGDRVVCEVAPAPALVAWVAKTAGKVLSQKDLFRLVRGYGDSIPDGGDEVLLGILASLRIVGNAELETKLAPNGRVTVSGMSGAVRVTQDLPGEIALDLPVFQGVTDDEGAERTYRVRALLDVEASAAEGLQVAITFPGIEVTLLAASEDLVAHVRRELGDPWTVCLGTETTQAVQRREGIDRIARRGSPAA